MLKERILIIRRTEGWLGINSIYKEGQISMNGRGNILYPGTQETGPGGLWHQAS